MTHTHAKPHDTHTAKQGAQKRGMLDDSNSTSHQQRRTRKKKTKKQRKETDEEEMEKKVAGKVDDGEDSAGSWEGPWVDSDTDTEESCSDAMMDSEGSENMDSEASDMEDSEDDKLDSEVSKVRDDEAACASCNSTEAVGMDIVTEENFRGVMLFCDGCECAWHIRCIHRSHRPTEVPAGDWFCTSCESNFHEAAHEELPEVRALTHTHAPSPTHDRTHTLADAPCYWELHWHATRCWCRKNHWRWALSRACRFEMPRCYGITGKSQSHLAFDLRLTRTGPSTQQHNNIYR
jgi:hypothetical protein